MEYLKNADPDTHERLKEEEECRKDFEEWWEEVPKKVGKGGARVAYKAAMRKANAFLLYAGIKAYAKSVKGKDPQYIAHPKTWLNQERWLDEHGNAGSTNTPGEHTDSQGVRRSDFTGSPMEGPEA